MKIVVYAIAKNEEQHVTRFLETVRGADLVVVGVDTTTTDQTKRILLDGGAEVIDVSVNPWRFDVARNLVLQHIPEDTDVCIALDLDEVLLGEWRKGIEEAWEPGTTMLRYPYIFSWHDAEMSKPMLSLIGFKIHSRNHYIWKYPIHETLEPIQGGTNEIFTDKVAINHYPDWRKPRAYQDILDWAVKDDPTCQRMSHLRGRELFMYGRYEEAIEELKRHLAITEEYLDDKDTDGIGQTRAASMKLISRSMFNTKKDIDEIIVWLLRAVSEAPGQREPWIWLGQAWYNAENYASAYAALMNGLNIKDRTRSIEIEEICWGPYPERLAAKCLTMLLFDIGMLPGISPPNGDKSNA